MDLSSTVHTVAQQERLRAALEMGNATSSARIRDAARTQAAAAPAPATSDVRARLGQRLGLSDPNASNEEIFAALDNTLAAAKAKRTQVDLTDALYNAAWGEPRTTPEPVTFASAEDAALYTIAFGKPMGA